MADVDEKTSLPIRTEADGLDERVHVKIVDFTDPGGVDKQVQVSENLVHNRNFGHDPAGVKVQMRLSQEGYVNGDGDYDAANNTRPNSSGLIAHDRNAVKTNSHLNKRISAVDSSVDVDVAIRDEVGNPYTADNPMPVSVEESEGEEIHDENASAVAIAKDASDSHVYTVPALKVFLLDQVMCSSSGRTKFEILTGASGLEVRSFVRFGSSSDNNPDGKLKRQIKVVAGDVVRVTRTNRDNQSMTLYSTIVGVLKDV